MKIGPMIKPGWKTWRFDQIAINVNDRIANPSESGMEHYVGLEHLDPDSLKIRRWGTPDDVESTKLCFKKGDIIFGKRRAYQRKLGVAEFDGICSAHALVLRPRTDVVLPEFLPFFMQSDLFMRRAVAISVGSLSPTINWKTLAAQEFALPPLDAQYDLEKVFSALDDYLNSAVTALAASQTARQSFLNDCFPENFEQRGAITQAGFIRPLCALAEIRTGLALGKKGEGVTVELPYLRVANVQDGSLDLSEIKTVRVKAQEVSRYELMTGDVLMTEGGDFDKLGRGAVWRGEIANCLHQNHVFAIRPNFLFMRPEYLAALGRSPHGKRYFRQCAKRTSNLASINKKQLSEFPVVYIPIELQDQIVEKIAVFDSSEMALIDRLRGTRSVRAALLDDKISEGR